MNLFNSRTPVSTSKVFYRRNLPHWHPPGATFFLTWRLQGTLPESTRKHLEHQKKRLRKKLKNTDLNRRERSVRVEKKMFELIDQTLHKNRDQVDWLARDRIAETVIQSLFHHHRNLYDLHEFVVLPNHVHLLLRPLPKPEDAESEEEFYALERINQSLKGYTARESNTLLDRTGHSFWQNESYDHWVRDQEEYDNIVQYIQLDPLRSDLVDRPDEWKWSSTHPLYRKRLNG